MTQKKKRKYNFNEDYGIELAKLDSVVYIYNCFAGCKRVRGYCTAGTQNKIKTRFVRTHSTCALPRLLRV